LDNAVTASSEQKALAIPKVSVIMSVYNGAKYLESAIDSIISQTYRNFEFIIINDGSTDDTSRILASYHDDRIIILNNSQNIGLTKSLNRGIASSRGELIARQDADDVSMPERLKYQVEYMDAHPGTGLLGTCVKWIDAEGAISGDGIFATKPDRIQAELLSSIPFLHGTFILRRSCMNEMGMGYNEEIPVAQDCDLLFRISERWDIANLPDFLYQHRRHEDRITAHRQGEQNQFLHQIQLEAINRRLSYGWGRLGLKRARIPEWVKIANRHWLADRFVWWSASCRTFGKKVAFEFLLIAILLDPTSETAWKYIQGIIKRKTNIEKK
jgi:O-antigen biosynthesis protein